MKKPALIALGLVLVALLVVLIQNLGGAELSLLFWNAAAPLSVVLVVTYLLGALTARPLGRAIRRAWKGQAVRVSMNDKAPRRA